MFVVAFVLVFIHFGLNSALTLLQCIKSVLFVSSCAFLTFFVAVVLHIFEFCLAQTNYKLFIYGIYCWYFVVILVVVVVVIVSHTGIQFCLDKHT